jgi:lipopolysaccharide/colanic/teichoic acid biosynthesis glycosyltransferase
MMKPATIEQRRERASALRIATATSPWPFPMHAIPVPADVPRESPIVRGLYRLVELIASVTLIVVTAPLMLLAALIIKLDSPGPVLFWHRRMGRSTIRRGAELVDRLDLIPPPGGFEPDRLYLVPTTIMFCKFRTMYADARARFPHLYEVEFADRQSFLSGFYKSKQDPRVTRVGRWLRRTTIDELPNLFPVLTGAVTLVGPRPEGHFVQYYTPHEMRKFAVKPGVTGLTQASGRGQLTIGEQLASDLDYVRRRSLWLDIQILFMTVINVIRQKGAF